MKILIASLMILNSYFAMAQENSEPTNKNKNLVYCSVMNTPMVYWRTANCYGLKGYLHATETKVKELVFKDTAGTKYSLSADIIKSELKLDITNIQQLNDLYSDNKDKIKELLKKEAKLAKGATLEIMGIGTDEAVLKVGGAANFKDISAVVKQPLNTRDCYYSKPAWKFDIQDKQGCFSERIVCIEDGKYSYDDSATCISKNGGESCPNAKDCLDQDEKTSPELYLKLRDTECSVSKVAELSKCFDVMGTKKSDTESNTKAKAE
jgi:hypothetical protein